MKFSRTIRRADWKPNPGEETDEHGRGICTVRYSTGRRPEFPDVERGSYFDWKSHKFDWRKPAAGVRTLRPLVHEDASDSDSELEQQEMDEEMAIESRRSRRQAHFDASNFAVLQKLGAVEFERKYGHTWLEKMKALSFPTQRP
jgi:hypothetical protein